MADSSFFKNCGPFTAQDLANMVNAKLKGNENLLINDVSSLENASGNTVSFLDNRKYISQFKVSKAGLCLVHPSLEKLAPKGMDLLITEHPYMAYATIATAFYPVNFPNSQISARATISENAIISDGVIIEAGVVIEEDVKIGKGTWLKANCVIQKGVQIGDNCIISSNVTVSHAHIGNAVYIHPGAQIGQDGFGFASGPQGHKRIPQLGRVIIEDHVNIGANTTIDRGAGPDTVIGAGTQIDNLVQIGHNVQIGKGCVIVSQVGVSGSTKIGNFVVCGGQVGIAGHLEIGDGAVIAAKAGVTRNLPKGQTMGGFPAIPQKEWLKQQATLSRITKANK